MHAVGGEVVDLGGPLVGMGCVFFGMGGVIREEKLVVGGGVLFGAFRGVLRRVWVLACVSAPVLLGVSGYFEDKYSEVLPKVMVSLALHVLRGGSGGGEVYSPILVGGGVILDKN